MPSDVLTVEKISGWHTLTKAKTNSQMQMRHHSLTTKAAKPSSAK